MHVMAKAQRKSAQLCFRVEPALAARLHRLVSKVGGLVRSSSEAAVAREALERGVASLEAAVSKQARAR